MCHYDKMLQFVCAARRRTCYTCRGKVLVKDLYLYRRWRLYGVDTDMPVDRQGHKCTQLLLNTHAQKNVPSPRTEHVSTGLPPSAVYVRERQPCITLYLWYSIICLSTADLFLLRWWDFHFACLPEHCQHVKIRHWSQTQRRKCTSTCFMIIYGGLLYSISCSTCKAQHFSDGSSGEKSEDGLNVGPEKQMT